MVTEERSGFNLITFIPSITGESSDVISMQELCSVIHEEPDICIDTVTFCASGYRRVVSGVPELHTKTITVFVSGWAGWPGATPYRYSGNAAYYAFLYQQAGIITGPCVCYDHPNQHYTTASFGQKKDQENLQYVLEKVRKANPGVKIILIGFSYGATTILNFISQQPEEYVADVEVVVLESPFIRLENVLRHSMYRFVWKYAHSLAGFVTRFVASYDPTAPTILELADAIPQRLRIFVGFIASDSVVPACDAKRIIELLRDRNIACLEMYQEKDCAYRHSYLSTSSVYAATVRSFLSNSAEDIKK